VEVPEEHSYFQKAPPAPVEDTKMPPALADLVTSFEITKEKCKLL
jgi:hypothetical protein